MMKRNFLRRIMMKKILPGEKDRPTLKWSRPLIIYMTKLMIQFKRMIIRKMIIHFYVLRTFFFPMNKCTIYCSLRSAFRNKKFEIINE